MLKPQDISVLCMLAHYKQANKKWNYIQLPKEVCLSTGEVHASVKRLSKMRLYNLDTKSVIAPNAVEFLVHGVKYCFPVHFGGMERGFPTAHSHQVFAGDFSKSGDNLVIPHEKGGMKGVALAPISSNIPDAISLVFKSDDEKKNKFYLLISLIDAVRAGRARERDMAVKLLRSYL